MLCLCFVLMKKKNFLLPCYHLTHDSYVGLAFPKASTVKSPFWSGPALLKTLGTLGDLHAKACSHTQARMHTCSLHLLTEQIQTRPMGGAALYFHITEGRRDEVQKKKLDTKLEEPLRRGEEAGEERVERRTNKTVTWRRGVWELTQHASTSWLLRGQKHK